MTVTGLYGRFYGLGSKCDTINGVANSLGRMANSMNRIANSLRGGANLNLMANKIIDLANF
jgi:hypothetical protein